MRPTYELIAIEDGLLALSLRAALRCVRRPQTLGDVRDTMNLMYAAQTCLAIFAAFVLGSAADEFDLLQRSAAMLVAHDRAGPAVQSSAVQDDTFKHASRMHEALNRHTEKLRQLPPALRSWVEAAMDSDGIVDVTVRQNVLLPLQEITSLTNDAIARADGVRAWTAQR